MTYTLEEALRDEDGGFDLSKASGMSANAGLKEFVTRLNNVTARSDLRHAWSTAELKRWGKAWNLRGRIKNYDSKFGDFYELLSLCREHDFLRMAGPSRWSLAHPNPDLCKAKQTLQPPP